MKRILISLCVACLIIAMSICSVGAYVLPEGIGLSVNEGEALDSIDADVVYGYMGDADENGKVNVRDATDIQKSVANIIALSDSAMKLADADLSGEVNVRDATAIQKWLAKMPTEAPVYRVLYSKSNMPQSEMLTGKYRGMVNISDSIDEKMIAEDPSITKFFDFELVETAVLLTFNPDGTYKIILDETGNDTTVEQFKAEYGKGMTAYLESYIKENKLEATVEDILKTSGYGSMEAMVDDLVVPEIVLDMIEFKEAEGRYAVKDGSIYVSSSLSEDVEMTGIEYYDFYGSNLILTKGNGIINSELHPVEFVRVD